MANFMQAFENQRENYLAHYGKKGMKWGVITSEYQPVGRQPVGNQQEQKEGNGSTPEYSEEDQRSMQASANAVRGADAESVKDKRKRIVRNIRKGVEIGAIVLGFVAGAKKNEWDYAKGKKEEDEFINSMLSNPTSKAPFGGYIGSGSRNSNSNRQRWWNRTKAGMTSAGERLRRKVNGG